MFHNHLTQRVIVCLTGLVAITAVGTRIFAADTDKAKPSPDEPVAKRSVTLEPAEPSTQPVPGQKFAVAMVKARDLFSRYSGREQLEKQFTDLQQQASAAQQSGDQQKMGSLRMQMQKMQADMRKAIGDALKVVAEREHYDIVVADVLYKSETTILPDLTDAVVEHLNTTTAPAADTQPAESADETPDAKEPATEK